MQQQSQQQTSLVISSSATRALLVSSGRKFILSIVDRFHLPALLPYQIL